MRAQGLVPAEDRQRVLIGGLTVVPVTATRSGWATLPMPRPLAPGSNRPGNFSSPRRSRRDRRQQRRTAPPARRSRPRRPCPAPSRRPWRRRRRRRRGRTARRTWPDMSAKVRKPRVGGQQLSQQRLVAGGDRRFVAARDSPSEPASRPARRAAARASVLNASSLSRSNFALALPIAVDAEQLDHLGQRDLLPLAAGAPAQQGDEVHQRLRQVARPRGSRAPPRRRRAWRACALHVHDQRQVAVAAARRSPSASRSSTCRHVWPRNSCPRHDR